MTSLENKKTIAALNNLITNLIVGNIKGEAIKTNWEGKLNRITFTFSGNPKLYTQEGDTYD